MSMKRKLAVYHVSLFFFALLGVFGVCADDKPKVQKEGGMPNRDLWKEEDVKKYLSLPWLASMDGIVGLSMNEIGRRVETAEGIAGYEFVKDNNRRFKLSNNKFPVISIELRGEGLPVLHVSVYDYRSWNDLCDNLFKYITGTVDLWNKIPDYYTKEEHPDAYTLTRKGGKAQRWHFALKNRYMISVDAGLTQGGPKSEEKVIAEMEKVVKELGRVLESKN